MTQDVRTGLEERQRLFLEGIRGRRGTAVAPEGLSFRNGWRCAGSWGEEVRPFLSCAAFTADAGWSGDHEDLHEDASRDHFIDRATRRSVLRLLAGALAGREAVFCDLGCSTGYLLEEVLDLFPRTLAAGGDLVAQGLEKCHRRIPEALLFQVDACDLPFGDGSLDALASLNVLEHLKDDRAALREFHRVLRPGGLGCLVAPHGPGLYDYYDEVLLHQRRYARGELARKAREAGFTVAARTTIGWSIYPAFWLVKKRNRLRFRATPPAEKRRRVEEDIRRTGQSRVAPLLLSLEEKLLESVSFPYGIRQLLLVKKEGDASGR